MSQQQPLPQALYHALAFVCMLQLPLTLLLSPHITRHVVRWVSVDDARTTPHGGNHSSSNSSVWGDVYTLHTEDEFFLASALVGLWACVYLYLGVLDDRHAFSGLSDSDDALYAVEEEATVSRWLDVARLCFWTCVTLHARVLWARTAWSDAELQWRVAQRVGALYALTRTFNGKRRLRFFHVLGAAVYLWTVRDVWPLTLALAALDALLLLGHLFDRVTPIRTVLNTRLFYLASASSVTLVWVSSSASSGGVDT